MIKQQHQESLQNLNNAPLQSKVHHHQGPTYNQLKPEVKATLDKIVYQVELVSKTVQLLETRVA